MTLLSYVLAFGLLWLGAFVMIVATLVAAIRAARGESDEPGDAMTDYCEMPGQVPRKVGPNTYEWSEPI